MEELEPLETRTPEERELDRKRAELAELESELIERELDLSTLEQDLAAFRADYLRIVGRRYATLDDIKARIAAVACVAAPELTVRSGRSSPCTRNCGRHGEAGGK